MSYRILIVDDSAATRALIASALETDPEFEVTETASGFEALRALPQGRFDLILTDINMPDINGLELVRFIKTSPLYKDKPLIIISSLQGGTERRRGLALGATDYVVKPFDPDALLQLCRSYLGAPPRS
ncbi:MAG TPA: response regulator [Myxococcota bacterium]|jgi:two-component system chemotaxis response regulator CheY|nr:response regulator [Myxococcota bacterium]